MTARSKQRLKDDFCSGGSATHSISQIETEFEDLIDTFFGDWTAYLFTALPVAQRMEKGEYGGVNGYDFISINRIDLFPAAGNLRSFSAYMYLKCPERTAAGVPPG